MNAATVKSLVTAATLMALSAPASAQTRFSVGLGATNMDGATVSLRSYTPSRHGFDWTTGLWATGQGSAWVGIGASYTWRPSSGAFFLRGSLMPGVYARGGGRDLGGPVQFATSVEIGTDLRNGGQISLAYEHRSNAGLYATNPGADTVLLTYTIPLN